MQLQAAAQPSMAIAAPSQRRRAPGEGASSQAAAPRFGLKRSRRSSRAARFVRDSDLNRELVVNVVTGRSATRSLRARGCLRREAATLGPAYYDQAQTRIRARRRISSRASRRPALRGHENSRSLIRVTSPERSEGPGLTPEQKRNRPCCWRVSRFRTRPALVVQSGAGLSLLGCNAGAVSRDVVGVACY
jgi:hypothetical protein